MPEADLTLLRDAAFACGKIALKYWRNSPDVEEKPGGAGPVSEADLEVDRMLHAELLNARPDYGWLSEETEDNHKRLKHERVFIVDPIDGTRAFIDGADGFSHSLAIAEHGKVIAAAVYLPVRDEMFLAAANGLATLNDVPVRATQRELEGAEVLGARPNFFPEHWLGDQAPPVKRKFRSSLAWRLCLVGQGRYDGMMTLRPTWEWDVAAGSLIAACAGATVSDLTGGNPVFNNRFPKLRGMMAAAPAVHAGLLSRLKPRAVPR